jgi:hypothetical protein
MYPGRRNNLDARCQTRHALPSRMRQRTGFVKPLPRNFLIKGVFLNLGAGPG